MNWQRNVANWVTNDRARPRRAWRHDWSDGSRDYNPAARVTSKPEFGTGQHAMGQHTYQGWPTRSYNYRKQGQFVGSPDWVAAEIFLPTETPKLSISPFLRRAGGIRVFGRFKSAHPKLNRNFDLFAGDRVADAFAHGVFQPNVAQWLLNDPRLRQVNLAFQTIVLWEGKDDVPFTQRHGVVVAEMPGRVETPGASEFLFDIGTDLLAQLPAVLWQGQPPSGRAGR